MKRYPIDGVRQLVTGIAAAVGVAGDDAATLADALVDADLHGTSTHGVSRLNIYVRRIQRGLIDPGAELRVETRRPAVLVVDAANGLGQVQAVKTLDLLKPLARQYGIASATIRRSQHFGALSYYSNLAAEHDMVLLAMTNCEPAMSPVGGCQAFFGTNPIAASFPTGKGFPLKVDLATSLVARGNVIAAHKVLDAREQKSIHITLIGSCYIPCVDVVGTNERIAGCSTYDLLDVGVYTSFKIYDNRCRVGTEVQDVITSTAVDCTADFFSVREDEGVVICSAEEVLDSLKFHSRNISLVVV